MNGISLLAASTSTWAGVIVLAAVVGGVLAVVIQSALGKSRVATARREAEKVIADAQLKAEQVIKTAELDARAEQNRMLDQFKAETAETRAELKGIEKRLTKREDNLDSKLETLSTKEKHLEKSEKKVSQILKEYEGQLPS